MSDFGATPQPEELQFQRAEPLPGVDAAASLGQPCVICKQPTGSTYYHAQGQVVCPACAQRIESGQQAPPAISLARAALFGGGAALAGSILYALVTIVTGLGIGLIAIVVGVMVGRAIRLASNGLGGRPQQILAVVLTYFAITTSYIPVMFYRMAKDPSVLTKRQPGANRGAVSTPGTSVAPRPPVRPPVNAGQAILALGKLLLLLLLITAAAPFLALRAGVSGLITLFIIFIGLQRAWKLTGRTEILVMGPYETTPAA
jgi:hypothetical protein